ncbi:hypothetical protein K474DRAFT_1679926 [Panus rudis PR-1116 ss-1]|nr:hypothetical protein K474DRAFT_1679926 [Panus rudis PR-1116 ss-1]
MILDADKVSKASKKVARQAEKQDGGKKKKPRAPEGKISSKTVNPTGGKKKLVPIPVSLSLDQADVAAPSDGSITSEAASQVPPPAAESTEPLLAASFQLPAPKLVRTLIRTAHTTGPTASEPATPSQVNIPPTPRSVITVTSSNSGTPNNVVPPESSAFAIDPQLAALPPPPLPSLNTELLAFKDSQDHNNVNFFASTTGNMVGQKRGREDSAGASGNIDNQNNDNSRKAKKNKKNKEKQDRKKKHEKNTKKNNAAPAEPEPQSGLESDTETEKSDGSCLKHYDPQIQECIKYAKDLCRIFVIVRDAFPKPYLKDVWGKEAWQIACENHDIDVPSPTIEMHKLITHSISHFRSSLRKDVCSLVAQWYNLRPGASEAAREHNKKQVALLLEDSAFIYPLDQLQVHSDDRVGSYLNQAIGDVVALWFKTGPSSLGVRFSPYFGGIVPVEAYAFACTLVHYALNSHSTGVYIKAVLNATEWRPVYEVHLMNIKGWADTCDEAGLFRLQSSQLYQRIRASAGVPPIETDRAGLISKERFRRELNAIMQRGASHLPPIPITPAAGRAPAPLIPRSPVNVGAELDSELGMEDEVEIEDMPVGGTAMASGIERANDEEDDEDDENDEDKDSEDEDEDSEDRDSDDEDDDEDDEDDNEDDEDDDA